MSLLTTKLILTPLLIGAATLAVRRWGSLVGGWFIGLPLTSGPVSLFLALEQGPVFAAQAAHGTLLGLIAMAAFCVAYARGARKFPWPVSLTFACSVYLSVAWGLSMISSSLASSTLLVALLLWAAVKALGVPVSDPSRAIIPRWDLPLRMAAATTMVLILTGSAEYLGPKWSGLLTPFPVFACLMAVFSQKQEGAASAQRVLRGVVIGSIGAASFLLVVGIAVERASLISVYILATIMAVMVNGISLLALIGGQDANEHGSATSEN